MDPVVTTPPKKLAVGWFSFTCCEDSTILFTELLNDNFDTWRKLVDFRHVNALKTDNKLEDLDVSFIEGAISSESQAKEVRKIRANSKYVVAIGACACSGAPSSSRNNLEEEDLSDHAKWLMESFEYSDKVRKLEDVIKVDDRVDGCPMRVPLFLEILTKYLKLFGLV